jgi:DNA polymerase-3 subunit delta
VDHGAFLRAVTRGEVPRVVLLHGRDAQLLEDALQAVSQALGLGPGSLDREVLDGSRHDPAAAVRAARTLPWTGRMRLVAVRRCHLWPPRSADELRDYVAHPAPASCLLLLADEPLGPSRERRGGHWLLSVVPAHAVVELPVRRGRALEEWLRQRAAAEGLTVSEEAARLLVQWVGEDSATLLAEVRKAAMAGSDGRTVGVAEVSAVVGEHRAHALWELTAAVERRELGAALRVLDQLLATEDPLAVVAALTRTVRMLWTLREWQAQGQTVERMARALGRPPGAVEALLDAARGQSPERLLGWLRRCWEVERCLKSGGRGRAELTALVAELAGGG